MTFALKIFFQNFSHEFFSGENSTPFWAGTPDMCKGGQIERHLKGAIVKLSMDIELELRLLYVSASRRVAYQNDISWWPVWLKKVLLGVPEQPTLPFQCSIPSYLLNSLRIRREVGSSLNVYTMCNHIGHQSLVRTWVSGFED